MLTQSPCVSAEWTNYGCEPDTSISAVSWLSNKAMQGQAHKLIIVDPYR